MKSIRSILACAICMALPLSSYAQQKEEPVASPWAFTLGAKAWVNTWTSWEITRVQSGGSSLQAITPVSASPEVAFMPLASMRYQRVFITASAMSETEYALENSLVSRTGLRSEADVNIGYDVLPGLSLSAGYKQLTQDVGGEYKWSGPTLAFSVSAPLQSGLSVYGTYGMGWMTVSLPSPDASGATSLDADYTLSEFGLAYSLGREQVGGFMGLTFTFGYRAQTVRTREYALSSLPSGIVYAKDDPRDYTQGFTFSVIGSF